MYVYIIYILYIDNTGWSATKAVYGDIKHLLCYWHVDRYVIVESIHIVRELITSHNIPEPGKTN